MIVAEGQQILERIAAVMVAVTIVTWDFFGRRVIVSVGSPCRFGLGCSSVLVGVPMPVGLGRYADQQEPEQRPEHEQANQHTTLALRRSSGKVDGSHIRRW
ncbi:MAG: hypothetical protein J0H86_06550 [Xanthomonadaceae bacterium]|nr:hypothetical protein [Xanthomonadaceae bacterium]